MARRPALTTEIGYVNPSATDPASWMPGSVPDMWWWELTEQVPKGDLDEGGVVDGA
jgi:hypothetical protein